MERVYFDLFHDSSLTLLDGHDALVSPGGLDAFVEAYRAGWEGAARRAARGAGPDVASEAVRRWLREPERGLSRGEAAVMKALYGRVLEPGFLDAETADGSAAVRGDWMPGELKQALGSEARWLGTFAGALLEAARRPSFSLGM